MSERKVKAITWSADNTTGLTRIYLCSSPLARLRGVFFRRHFSEQDGVLLRRCSSVHSVGLRRSLVVIFLDLEERVLSVQTMQPNQVRSFKGAKSVLELHVDSALVKALDVGDQLDFGQLLKKSRYGDRAQRKIIRGTQAGASMVEFLIVAPIIIYLGVGIIQMGLVYHARNVVDYATFEAARAGAVHQADPEEMRRELSYRLGPVFSGDGSASGVRRAVQRSLVAVNDPLRTQIRVINPTAAAFEDFGVVDPESGKTVLPNAHLQHRSADIGPRSGVNIQDANLLKIEVTYGYELKLPWFNIKLPGTDLALKELMTRADPVNAVFYSRGQIPLRAVATVRMQSKAIVNNVTVDEPGSIRPETDTIELIASNATAAADQTQDDDQTVSEECTGPYGLPDNLAIESLADNEVLAQCAVSTNEAGESATASTFNEPVQVSTNC